jgi:hypothetical protein
MNPCELFLREHAAVHTKAVAQADLFNMDYLVEGLTEAQLRTCPYGMNSIAWIFWHISRAEDDLVSSIVMSRPPLYDAEKWGERLAVSRRNDGNGMNKAEVTDLSSQVNLSALFAYRDAVGRNSRTMVKDLWPDRWASPIERADILQAKEWGVLTPRAAVRMARFLPGRPRENALLWWGLHHTLMHLGQISMLRSVVMTAS